MNNSDNLITLTPYFKISRFTLKRWPLSSFEIHYLKQRYVLLKTTSKLVNKAKQHMFFLSDGILKILKIILSFSYYTLAHLSHSIFFSSDTDEQSENLSSYLNCRPLRTHRGKASCYKTRNSGRGLISEGWMIHHVSTEGFK